MKRALVLISMVGLGFLFAWGASEDTSQQKAELESLKTELQQLKPNIEKAENEKSALEVEIAVEQQNREQLQKEVDELTSSRVKLQKQVEKLTFTCEQSRQQLEEIVEVRDKLKQRITELTGSRDELKQQLTELTTSRNQLERQVDELSRSREAAAVRAQTAQDRVDILLALVDAETEGIGELQQQNEITITNQAKEDMQPPIIEVSEDPNVLTAISWPPVVSGQAGERPICHSFSTSRPQIMPSQTSILSWQVSDADRIRIEPDIGRVSALGSRAVKPAATTTYTLIATNQAGESRITCRVEVDKQLAVRIKTIEQPVVPAEAIKPELPVVSSAISEPKVVSNEVIKPPVVSSAISEPKVESNKIVEPVIINDKVDGRPICHSFNTTRPRIMPGQTSTLSWQVSNAESIRIEPGIGRVSALGSRAVKPAATTTYTLIAGNKAGLSRMSCRVEISERITIFSTDSIHPQVLLEEYKASDDSKVLPGQKPPVSDPNSTLGKFLGYRARKDETGKFIFIPVYENKLEK
jgi:prefoldin subunit 5